MSRATGIFIVASARMAAADSGRISSSITIKSAYFPSLRFRHQEHCSLKVDSAPVVRKHALIAHPVFRRISTRQDPGVIFGSNTKNRHEAIFIVRTTEEPATPYGEGSTGLVQRRDISKLLTNG